MPARRPRSKPAPSRRPGAAEPPAIEDPALRVPGERLVLFALLCCTFVLCVVPMSDTDIWWHLRTGELIWQEGRVPLQDRYLFTDFGRPWTDLHWGFQLLMAGLYHLGGVNLLILTKAVVITAAVAIAWHASGNGLPAWLRAALWVPAIISITGRAHERPEMLSQLFLALWLFIAFQAKRRPRSIWWLPAIQVVWINCHALFVLGLYVGACFAIDLFAREFAQGRWNLEPPSPAPTPRHVASAGILCGVAALCNPYFEEGALFPLVLYRKFSVEQAFYSVRIGEFQQPWAFLKQGGWWSAANIHLIAQVVLALLAVSSFVLLARRRSWSPFRLLLFAGFAHLGWEATRNVNIFAFVSTVVLVANVVDLKRLRAAERLVASEAPQPSRERRANRIALALLAAWTLVVVSGLWGRKWVVSTRKIGGAEARRLWSLGEAGRFGLGERRNWYAHDAARFAGQHGFPTRAVVAHMGQAAVYEYHNGPARTVFMDPRLEVATQETFETYELLLKSIARGDRRWESSLRDDNGQLPLILLDSRYSRPQIEGLLRTPGWRLVYADASAAVFIEQTLAERLHVPEADIAPLIRPPDDA